MLLGVGAVTIVGFALVTVTETEVVVETKFAASVGLNVTEWELVPTLGAVDGAVKAKLPAVEAVPPERVELVNVWPNTMSEPSGNVVMDGVALATVTDTLMLTVL